MHGTAQGTPIPLTTFGGLVTLAKPESQPEGASPRNYDVDYMVGSVQTRPGLTSVYSFSGAAAGPSGGGAVQDRATGGIAWTDPGNVLLNTGVYASAFMASTGSTSSSTSTGTSSGGGVAWANPENIDSSSSFATVTLSAGGTNYTPSSSSGSVSNVAGPSNTNPAPVTITLSGLPNVAATSATLYVNVSATVSSSRGGGGIQLTVSTDSGISFGPPVAGWSSSTTATVPITVTGITNLNTVQIQLTAYAACATTGFANAGGSVTSWYATVAGSAQLTAQTLSAALSGLAVPFGANITGFGLSFTADYAGAAPSFMVGLNVGNVEPAFSLTTAPAVYSAGGDGSLWGYTSWTPATLNSLAANFFASASNTCTVSVKALVATVYYSAATVGTDALDITHFGFSVPSSSRPLGFLIPVKAYASTPGCTLHVQMLKAGSTTGSVISLPMPTSASILTIGGNGDLLGSGYTYSDLNNTGFGVRISATGSGTIFVGYTTVTAYLSPSQTNFDFITTFTAQDGTVRNVSLDASGNLWVENVTANPGVLALATEGIKANSYAVAAQGEGALYLAFNDGTAGCDMPRQYTPDWIDRITQVGPGAAPAFAPVVASANTYAISTITQPAAYSDPGNAGHLSCLLWSAGPGNTSSGNVLTVYYQSSFNFPIPDHTLVDAFNKGQSVYVYISTAPFGNGTFQVTSVGNALPPGLDHYRYYFTVQMPTASYQRSVEPVGQYQVTVATMTTSVAVPGLIEGSTATVAGASVASFDSAWPISQTVNSGAMAITATAVTGGVATYTYSVSSGANPASGELVTITGTTNANGGLNQVNVPIVAVSGTTTGTFTVNVSASDAPTAVEQGQATTAGTIFQFDPGLLTLGTLTNPIYGNSTGGTLTFAGPSGQFIGSGTRQGVVFFITRNGYYTAPSPPVTFTCPSNTTSIDVTLIPIGPPNVIARGIALTEAGQNGVPGANFFTIPTPVSYTVQNVPYTATALILNDNTTTSASFFFTDPVLLNAKAIDVYGYNLFNQIEIGDPGWVVSYALRNAYGLCLNKIQNFNNLSFDGGYLPGATLRPLGWAPADAYGGLQHSPVFGNSYYIKNTTGGTLATAGMLSQTAYQDAYQQPILNANTAYSVRLTARIPSGLTTGNLVVTLTANGATYGTFTVPFSSMTTSLARYTGPLLTSGFLTVPAALNLNVSASVIGAGADVEIDRLDVFPTNIPVLGTSVFMSYAGLPEQVDAVTGVGQFTSENQQPVNGAVVMYDTLYGLKGQGPGASMYSWQASANLEPANWNEPEVAQRAGACGPMAFDFGEQWLVEACRNGLYLFEGGQPGKINQEIYQVWDAINWQAAHTIWVKNDVTGRRLFVGVPLPTPNFWLPDAPVNANPTSPNVILVCNYQGLDTGQEIKSAPQIHTTMFGTLNAVDMRRKWTIWQIASPYGAFVQTAADKAFYLCNGAANSKVYMLDPDNEQDDGAAIDSLYTTYGFVDPKQGLQMPMLGAFRKRFAFMTMSTTNTQPLAVRLLPDTLLGPGEATAGYGAWTVPGGFDAMPIGLRDRYCSLNFAATRAYVELRGANWQINTLTLYAKKDAWNTVLGVK